MIEFVGNVARKVGALPALAVEFAKTRQAAEIAEDTGAFYVPRVLRFDERVAALEFERLRNLHKLKDLATARDPRLGEMLQRAGRALAIIHSQLRLQEDMRIEMPAPWMALSAEHAFLHGDYTAANVCFHETTGNLVILDWAAGQYLRSLATFGPRYFDLAWFTISLQTAVPARRIGRWPMSWMADTFLKGYLSARSESLDGNAFHVFRCHCWRLYFSGIRPRLNRRPWYKKPFYLLRESYLSMTRHIYRPGARIPIPMLPEARGGDEGKAGSTGDAPRP